MIKNDKSKIASIVLDVLKPHKPNIIELAKEINNLKSVKETHISVRDKDDKTENISVLINGTNLDINNIIKKIDNFGAVIHSIDEVIIN
jgi:uncharacterized protein